MYDALTTGVLQGIGLMIASMLVANGTEVYIMGPEQTELN